MSLPPTMMALQMTGLERLETSQLPTPEPAPGEVLVQTSAATICTSDLHDLRSNPFHILLPRVLGHESSGTVVACGAGVTNVSPGTRVAVHPVIPCGKCESCDRNLGHLCVNMGHLGYDRDGAFAQFFTQRGDRLRSIPDELGSACGALLEPVTVCLQALRRGGEISGRSVLIVGDGPFGNIIARLAKRAGAGSVSVLGREPFRLDRIRGASIIDKAPVGKMDIAILAVDSTAAFHTCIESLRRRGRLVLFSAISKTVEIDFFKIHTQELEIVGACNDEELMDEALACLMDPSLALHELITHELPFSDWKEAFGLARNGHDRALKVALTF